MRLTLALLSPRMWIHMRGRTWHATRKRGVPDDVNLHRIMAAGYNVVEATDYVKEMSPLYQNYDRLPEVPSRFPQPPKRNSTNPDWHNEPCKVFDDSTFPIEGVQQALAFTKSVKAPEWPKHITERANGIQLTEKDEQFTKRIVQQAFLWDAYLEKLPKVRDLEYPSLVPRREFGIPWERSSELMMLNFIRFIESQVSTDISLSRMIAPQHQMRVNLRRHDSLVQFRLNPLAHIMSVNPIEPVLDANEVEDTKLLPLSDIYPFLSTANMEEDNIYKKEDYFGVKGSSKFSNIHTSIFSHHIPGSHTHIHPRWNDDRFAGTTIMYNFATALLIAKQKYGHEFRGILPKPITTQVVHLTGREFQFSIFQLNTLDLEDKNSTSTKNNVWVTDKMQLCNIKNDYGKEIFENYNPEIVKLVFAMYLS